jgi:hypothetical protein
MSPLWIFIRGIGAFPRDSRLYRLVFAFDHKTAALRPPRRLRPYRPDREAAGTSHLRSKEHAEKPTCRRREQRRPQQVGGEAGQHQQSAADQDARAVEHFASGKNPLA